MMKTIYLTPPTRWIGKLTKARLLPNGPVREIAAHGVPQEVAEFAAYGARINILEAEITGPSAGRAAPRGPGQTTLNLMDTTTAQTLSAAIAGGGQAEIHVQAAAQKRGHPSGEHMWLPLGVDDRFICEPGVKHRKWYLSKSPTALTKAQIAGDAGVAESVVTAQWLLTRPQYGGTEQTAINANMHEMLRTGIGVNGRSDHWFLERGYDYTNLDWGGFGGQDELHPVKVAAWGTGADPVVRIWSNSVMLPYSVVQDVKAVRMYAGNHQSLQAWFGYGAIYDHIDVGYSVDFQWTTFFTIREATILSAYKDFPLKIDNGKWLANGNHVAGVYAFETDSILIDSCEIDHPGWKDGYDYNGDATMPHPVSKYSHCVYLQTGTLDVTVRYCLLSRAAAGGFQMRSGLQAEGNLMVDNNVQAAINSFSGQDQFNNFLDNVAFSAGYRRVAYEEGGFNWGYDVKGPQSSMVGNVIAHRANPDDPAEMAAKPNGSWAYGVNLEFPHLVEDTQAWKWSTSVPARNVEGIDPVVLDQTTIQRFTGIKLGKTFGTIPELVAHVAAASSIGNIVREAVRWTKDRFGTPIPSRTTPADLVFYPDPRIEGFRWDNRYNWSTKDLPGANIADTVDLGGNFVRFGNTNADIAALESNGGLLDVVSGKLEIGALSDAAEMIIRKAGQVWVGASDQPLSVEAVGGRLALEGAASNLDLYAGGQAQALLGPNCTVLVGKSLVVSGQRARVGWDGTGTAALTIGGKLEFRRGVEVTTSDGGQEKIRFVYKHIGQQVTGSISGFTGRVAAVERASGRAETYKVWFDDVVGTPQAGDVFTVQPLRKPDGTETKHNITIGSVNSMGVTPLQPFRSGSVGDGLTDPTVTATVTLASTAQIVIPAGLPSQDLTGPGVTVVNEGATLPGGVTLTGGKLIYTAA
ncbi:hypothetical protein [Paracoccus sp. AK26]|uniref:hypothetical protein n=1 Tax=Paracoccus sp. AK26 TaxID=2589076 RepID=UPI001427F652|nr:hypothetical protein [Paracoccus sp. AK26]QIR84998.1 hypothetical protein FIU66_07140 [Paracoccus sp. AK26]